MLKRLLRHPRVQALLVRLVAGYLSLCYRTTRWTVTAPEPVPMPCVIAFWHERLPLMTAGWQRLSARPESAGRRAHVLVSRHRDGRLIGDVIARFGVSLVHASSSKGAVAGLKALLDILRRGDVVGITPDGPRGPRRVAAPGAAQLAALAGVPVVPCAARTKRGFTLSTWDRMVLPLPFGRGAIVIGAPIAVARGAIESATAAIAASLDECCAAADRSVGR